MRRELARKRPAVVVRAEPATTTLAKDQAVIRATSKAGLAAEVTKLYRAGKIERSYETGRMGEVWMARVTFRRQRSPWLKIGGVITLALAAAGMTVWIIKAIVVAMVAAFPYVIGLVVALGAAASLASLAGGGRIIEVVQKVKIKG